MTKAEQAQRDRLIERDGGLCQIRGPRCTYWGTEIDHIEPRGLGGHHGAAKEWNERDENKRLVCQTDHIERHSGGRVYVA